MSPAESWTRRLDQRVIGESAPEWRRWMFWGAIALALVAALVVAVLGHYWAILAADLLMLGTLLRKRRKRRSPNAADSSP